jgi:D,D-heptose 1,7-bisphosphate phosphatase
MTEALDHIVVVAGGKGTRLSTVTGDVPKALVPVGGKPVLEHQLELARQFGYKNATIFAGVFGEQIEAFVGDGGHFGLSARVLIENEPLGNAGAVLQSLAQLPEQFSVIYGDLMLAVDLKSMAEAHLKSAADFTALVHPNDHPFDSDLLEVDEHGWVRAVHLYPHPSDAVFDNRVNAALYMVRRDALLSCAFGGRADFTKDVMPSLIRSGARVRGYASSDYLKDMGTPERLARVEADWKSGKISIQAAKALSPAVFLDRDGTLNADCGYLSSPEQLRVFPGVGTSLRRLRQAGFKLVVVTNQPVIARGEASETDIAAIHRRLEWDLGKDGAYVDAIYYCPHHPDSGFPRERSDLKGPCQCRKPGTAMVERAAREHRIELSRSWMVGDQTTDLELARRAGLRSILVRTGLAGSDRKYEAIPDHIADDLAAAADAILSLA